jgi:hypothetical protein
MSKLWPSWFFKFCLILGVCLEFYTLLLNYSGHSGVYITAVLWFLGGFLTILGAYPQLVFGKSTSGNTVKSPIKLSKNYLFALYGLAIVLAFYTGLYLNATFKEFPVSIRYSDVIPTIQILVERFMKGQWIYAPIQFPTWVVHNAYLPMQYVPFLIPEILHFDYRVFAYLTFVFVVLAWIRHGYHHYNSILELVIKTCLVFLSIFFLNLYDNSTFAFSLEMIDVTFYVFLALSFFSKDWKIRGVAILFCLLSRYAFIIWLPFYAVSYWLENGKKEALKVIGLVISGVILLYVLPFLTKQPTLFFDGLKYYDITAIGQWTDLPDWSKIKGKPNILTQGLSTSIYFYDNLKGDPTHKLYIAKYFHLFICILGTILISFLYRLLRKKKDFNYNGYSLLSLKFYFILFYGFFYVPFSYLYLLPFLFSVAIIYKMNFVKK